MSAGDNRAMSALTTAATLTGVELVELVQDGVNVRATLDALATFSNREVVTLNYFDYLPAAKVAAIAAGTDTTTNQSTYWQAFRDALAAIATAGGIPHGVIPQCVIRTSTAPNFAIEYLQLETHGMPRIIATAAVSGFKVDGTGLGPGAFGVRFMRVGPLIASTTTGSDGIYIKKVHQSEFLGLLNLGAVSNGIVVNGCVSTVFRKASCTSQPEAFLATPAQGLLVTGAGGAQTSWCLFDMPVFEYVPIGISLDFALGNSFVSGVAEGCTNTGMSFTSNALYNKVYGTDFEANTSFDVYCEGARNEFHGIDSGGTSLFTTATALHNRIFWRPFHHADI